MDTGLGRAITPDGNRSAIFGQRCQCCGRFAPTSHLMRRSHQASVANYRISRIAMTATSCHCLMFLLLSVGKSQAFQIASTLSNTGSPVRERESTSLEALRVGFIGCGTIASAIATGLATQDRVPIDHIQVSKRSETKSSILVKSFPDLITTDGSNQAIVDNCDLIFLCVLPQIASKTLQDLSFDSSQHTLVSLVSTATIGDLVRDSQLDAVSVSKMICLPSVARHQGVCLLCSPTQNPMLEDLFNAVGGVVALQTEKELNACMMTTCVMGPIYGIMLRTQSWLVQKHGIAPRVASYLVAKQFEGAVQDAVQADSDNTNPNRLEDLIAEQTPGGLNEQALRSLDSLGALDSYENVMDAILERIQGK